ncbi:MAG: transketolase, partial [Mycoplasma sp.]|nr:transketolase [Mycoplasma sp.]
YILTHDSVFVGEDGPTHQPIEQLAMLRSIPGVNVFRPADENEVSQAYEIAINSNGPSVILLTRQNVKSLEQTKKNDLVNGYYAIHKTKSNWNIIATGSELESALTIAKELNLNCYSLFNHNQIENYQLNKAKTITIEASSSFAMAKFGNYNLSIDNFGYSGPGDQVYKKCNMDLDSLRKTILTIIDTI